MAATAAGRPWFLEEPYGLILSFVDLGVLIAVLVVGGWLRDAWMTNVLRNYLDAKRRLRRGDPPSRPNESMRRDSAIDQLVAGQSSVYLIGQFLEAGPGSALQDPS